MRITVVRTGGFAGITRTYAVDSADLPPADATSLLELANAVLHSATNGVATFPDAFQYDLQIEDAGGVHHVTVVENPSPSPALELARSVIHHDGLG